MHKSFYFIVSLTIITTLFSACVSIQFSSPTQTPYVITATPLPPLPTRTYTPLPPPTLMPTVSPPTPTSPLGIDRVKIFLIAVGDNGASGKKIGCEDSLVPVVVAIPPTLGVLRAALTELFKLEGQAYYGASGLYNALYQSHLSIVSLNIVNREAIMHLKGTLMLGGECDNPRVKAQLEEIALQFSKTVDRVSVFIDGVPLDKKLSLK